MLSIKASVLNVGNTFVRTFSNIRKNQWCRRQKTEDVHQRVYAICTEGIQSYSEGFWGITPYTLHNMPGRN